MIKISLGIVAPMVTTCWSHAWSVGDVAVTEWTLPTVSKGVHLILTLGHRGLTERNTRMRSAAINVLSRFGKVYRRASPGEQQQQPHEHQAMSRKCQ